MYVQNVLFLSGLFCFKGAWEWSSHRICTKLAAKSNILTGEWTLASDLYSLWVWDLGLA